MTTKPPHTYMRRLFLFWQAADAVLRRRGEPPLTYEEACAWLDAEVELDDVPTVLRTAALRIAARRRASHHPASQRNAPSKDDAPWDDRFYEERLSRGWLDEQS